MQLLGLGYVYRDKRNLIRYGHGHMVGQAGREAASLRARARAIRRFWLRQNDERSGMTNVVG
jgi:hypothetical protein